MKEYLLQVFPMNFSRTVQFAKRKTASAIIEIKRINIEITSVSPPVRVTRDALCGDAAVVRWDTLCADAALCGDAAVVRYAPGANSERLDNYRRC